MLIIVGGKNRYTTLSSMEMFDSTTGQWYICEDLATTASQLAAVCCSNS